MDRIAIQREQDHGRQSRIQRRAHAESMQMLATNLQTGIASGILAAAATVIWLWPFLGGQTLMSWALALGAGMLVTIYLIRVLACWGHDTVRSIRLEACFAANAFYNGAIWGALPLLGGFSEQSTVQIVMTMILGVVALGGTGILAPSRVAFFAFVVPLLGPVITVFAVTPPPAMPQAAVAASVFALMLFALHELFHQMLRSTLTQRLTSDNLAEEQRIILESTAEAIILTRGDRLLKCNKRFADLVGEPTEHVLGRPLWQWLADPNEWHRHAQRARRIMSEGLTFRIKVRVRRANGELLWVEFNADAVDPARLEKGVVWTGQDLTSRMHSEATLHASEERYRRLITLTSDWYWEWDANLRFTHLSGPGLKHAGLSPAIYGHALGALHQIGGVSTEGWAALQRQIEKREPFRDFIWQLKGDQGTQRWFSMSGNPTFDTAGNFAGYHGIGSEVTEQMRGTERFRQLAYHDTLTGLPNRRLLDDRLHLAIAQAARRDLKLAVMVVDLDNFKIINDTAGHAVGDLVLVSVAKRLQSAIRASDTVARLGGDEFVVILPDVDTESAHTVATKITSSLALPVEAGDRQYMLGGSVGLAIYPEDGTSARTLLAHADSAMYEAKRLGGGRHMAHGEPPRASLGDGAEPRRDAIS
ncbi:diguanylate cyclase domain-containing protein [Nitrogeniibacter aestuarii]|uniref:diguanylate cyclase domain-containing protein n=1 Tax=Nitrogeniibacter aestuarii TaxID=2815343 RepID=UPI001D12457A|nr:diguanylate cyclase [Nitrogeniibacter aestuarii]